MTDAAAIRATGMLPATVPMTRARDTEIDGLAHELWAMAQGPGTIEDAIEPMMVELHGFAFCIVAEEQAARAELMKQLQALVDRYAYDGVPSDSLPVLMEARGVLARFGGCAPS